MQLLATKNGKTLKFKGPTQKYCLNQLARKVKDTRGYTFNWIEEPIKTN